MQRPIVRFGLIALGGIIPIVVFLQLPMGTWDDVAGLPDHPLVVHLVVVLLPVVAVWTIVAAWRPKVLDRTFIVLFATMVVATLATIVAKSSGNSLTAAVGLPKAHAAAGDRLLTVAIVLTGVVLLLGGVHRLWPRRPARLASSLLVTIVAVLVVPLTFVAGHSGAEATWKDRYAEASAPIAPAGSTSTSDSPTFTMDDVRLRNSPDACWTVVDGAVYDVTSFIQRHPAGPRYITAMCGKDASEGFGGQHQGQDEPEEWLATLRIGSIGR